MIIKNNSFNQSFNYKLNKIDNQFLNKKKVNRDKLKEVSQQIESIFLKMMYKEMKKNIGKNSILKINQGQKIFSDLLLEERTKLNTKHSSIGLSKLIYNQYK